MNVPMQYAADRPLVIADVRPFAKKDCQRCHGDGYVILIFHAGAKAETREPRPCACTMKHFKKKYANDIVLVDGSPFWKLGKAPPITTEPITPTAG